MDDILTTVMLEYDKSTFIFDLMKHHSKTTYIRILQSIEGNENKQELKINPSILNDFIFVLSNYSKQIILSDLDKEKAYFSELKQKKIIDNYLKGITILDLAKQLGCDIKIIEQILRNKNLEIVNNKLPKKKSKRYRR